MNHHLQILFKMILKLAAYCMLIVVIPMTLSSQCNSSYPYRESFEVDFGIWSQSSTDDFDWIRTNVPTAIAGTGPNSAFQGDYFITAQSTGNENTQAQISSCHALFGFCHAELIFNYHMLGTDMGELNLEVSTDFGNTWTSVWSESGDQGPSWYVATIDLSAYLEQNVQLRYTARIGSGPLSDMALDNVRLYAYQEAAVNSVIPVNPTCEDDNGSLEIFFNDQLLNTEIQFSLDGGLVWQSVLSDDAGNVRYNNLAPGTYDIRARVDNALCDEFVRQYVLVNQASPVVTYNQSTTELCTDDQVIILDQGLPAGGVYTGNGVSGNSFNPAISGPGDHTITYTFTDGNGCVETATDNIEVFAPPAVILTLTEDNTCDGNTTLLLNGGIPSGGTYIGPGVTGTNFDASVAGLGQHTITYTFTDGNGCQGIATDQIIVNNNPFVGFNIGDTEACITETGFDLSNSVSPPGGTFTGNGVTGNIFNAIDAGLGTHTLTYTYTDSNGCENSDTAEITVIDLPNVTLSLTQSASCSNEFGFNLEGGMPLGGTYSGPGVGGTYFDITIAGIGVHEVSYTYTDPITGCTNSALQDVTIFEIPNVSLTLGTNQTCPGETTLLLSGGIPSGGTYTGPGVTGTNFDASAVGVGTHTITYTFTDGNGCVAIATDNIIVHDSPIVVFNIGDNETCVTDLGYDLSGTVNPMGGTFSGPGVTGSTFEPSVAGVGTHTLMYTFTDSNGCTSSLTQDMIVYDLPMVTFSLADDSACEDESGYELSGSVSPAGGYFVGPGIAGSIFNANVAGVGVHTLTYGYNDGNGCNAEVDITFEVFALPNVSLTLDNNEACLDETTLLLSGGIPSGGTYTGPGVTGTNFDASSVGVGTHTITYTFTDGNGCIAIDTDNIIVHELPVVVFNIGDNETCVTDLGYDLSGTVNPMGGTFSGPGVTGSTFEPSVAGVGTHTLMYTFTDSNGCTSSLTQDMIVYDLPMVTFSLADDSACEDESGYDLSGSVSPAGGYFVGPGITGSTFDANVAGVGVHTLTYGYNDGNGCNAEVDVTFEVFALPNVSLTLDNNEDCIDGTTLLLSGGIPFGGTYTGPGVTGTNFDASVAGIGPHTITYTFTDGNGCIAIDTDNIIVHDNPVVTFNLGDNETCVSETGYDLSGSVNPMGGTFSGPGVTGNIFNAIDAGVGTHTLTYEYTDGNGCTSSATNDMIVYDLPVVTYNQPILEVCADETTLTLGGGAPAGGFYSGPGVTGTVLNVATAGIGNHTITYTYTDTNGCTNTDTKIITVHAIPIVDLTLDIMEVCVNETIALSGESPSGGVFSGTGVVGNTFVANTAGVGTHTVFYTYTDANGCSRTVSDFVIVSGLPSVQLSLTDNHACITDTQLTLGGGSPAGGTYSGITVSGNQFNPSVAGLGNHEITYTFVDGNGCENIATENITVHVLPVVDLILTQSEACVDLPGFTLSGESPAGGTFSGTGVSGNYFDIAVAGVGIHEITYTYTDPLTGCEGVAQQDVVIYSEPVVNLFLQDAEVCYNETNVALTGATPAGGTFSGPGVTSNTFDATVAGIGTHTITYTFSDANGCEGQAVDQIEVLPETILGLNVPMTECVNNTSVQIVSGTPTGGTYSGPGVTGDIFNPSSAGLGVHTITYTFTDANGCTNSITDEVEVVDPPTVSLNLDQSSDCIDSPGFNLSGGIPVGGTYSGTGVSGNYFDITITGIGNHTVTYTYTDPATGCSQSVDQNVTIFDLPIVELDITQDQLCETASLLDLTAGAPSGGDYSGPGVTGSQFDPSVSGIGIHTITYTFTDNNGCTNFATDQIEVIPAPLTTLNLPQNTFCVNESIVTLTGATPAGGLWSGPGVTGNQLDLSIAGQGTHTISYSFWDGAGCTSVSEETITVFDIPAVDFVLSDTQSCITETVHLLDGASPTGGVFSGPGVTGNNFNPSIAGLGTHTIEYTVTDANGCTNSATQDINVNNLPTPQLNLITDELCIDGASITLSGGIPAGGSYSGPGVTGNTFDPAQAGVGTHIIRYFFDNGTCSAEAIDELIVHDLPVLTIDITTDVVCNGDIVALAGASPAGGTWSGPGVSGNRFNSTAAGIGTHTLTYSYTDGNGCEQTIQDDLAVFDLPIVDLVLAEDEDCESNNNLTLSGGTPVGGTYTGNGVTGTNFNASTAGQGNHLITYTFIDANGCEDQATDVITVFAIPDVNLNLTRDNTCIDSAPVILSGGTPAGGVWSGPGVTGNQIDPTLAGIGTHLISYTFTVNGCTDVAQQEFIINELPTLILDIPDTQFCLGENVALTGGTPVGGTYSGNGVNVATGQFRSTVAGLGTHTITYTFVDDNGCEAMATQDVTVNDVAEATLNLGIDMACATETNIPLSGGSPSGGTYSGPGITGNFMDATDPSVNTGANTVFYTYLDANGCEATAIDIIEISSNPDVDFTQQDEDCGKNNGSVSFTFFDNPDVDFIEFSTDGGITWRDPVNDNTGSVTYNFFSSGDYDLLVRNLNGTCEHMVGTATIENNNGPTANAGSDVTIFPPASTVLNGSGGNIYNWSPSTGLNNTSIPNPTASPIETTTYTLAVTDLNGCVDTDEVTVIVVPPCSGTISEGGFPYRESFETGIGLWAQDMAFDDFDMTLTDLPTPTVGTGPDAASEGVNYLFAEANGNNNSTSMLNGPCFDLRDQSCAQFTFDYHMTGAQIGDLNLEISLDFGQTWTSLWSNSVDQGDMWATEVLDLFGFLDQVIQLRFITTIGNGNESDIAIDNVEFITTGCGCDDTSSPFDLFNLVPDPQPFSVDIDCDGDADMLAGGDGELFYFENNGDGTYTDLTGTASDPMPNLTHLDMTIGFADLDGDGDLDMSLVGNEPFNKRFYWNTGTKFNPQFTLAGTGGTPPNPIQVFDFSLLDGGFIIGFADPTIFWADLDGDNDMDAVVGGKLGWFLYYENIGDENNPIFALQTGSNSPFDGLRADGEDEGTPTNPCPGSPRCQFESAPFLVDWDGDGDLDMFSGNQVSTVQYFENVGDAFNPDFVERTGDANPFDGIIFSEDSHLSLIDEDCDGDWDVFYGVGDTPDDAEITLCDLLVATPNEAIANSDQSHYCIGSSVFLLEQGTTGVTWEWEGPNGFTSNLQNPSIPNITEAGAGTYSVTVTNTQGCEHINSTEITVSGATAGAGAQVCIEQGDNTTLQGSGTGDGITIEWSPPTGLSNTTIFNPIASPTTTTTYTLTVTDFFGCQVTDEVTIIVKSDICVENEQTFFADFETTTGDNFWTFNTAASDGDFVIGVPTPYFTAGNLMEENAFDGIQSLVTGIDIGRDLDLGPATARSRNITLSATATNIEISLAYYFSHVFTANTSDFLNIEIRDASNGTILHDVVNEVGAGFNRPANWTAITEDLSAHAGKTIYIWVEAADLPGGTKLEVGIDNVRINETVEIQAEFSLDPPDFCTDIGLITLEGGTPAGGVYSGPGVTGNIFDPIAAGPGQHEIVYTLTTVSGCIAAASVDVEIFDLPTVDLALDVPEACDIETSVVLFGGIPTGGTYSGTGVTGDIFNPSAAGSGDHVITYTVSDANGCENIATDIFVVNATPVISLVTSQNASCGLENGSITIDFNDVSEITNIEFSLDGGLTWETPVPDADGTVTYSNLPVGNYNVLVADADSGCAIDIDDAIIFDEPGPQVNAGLDQVVCDGDVGTTTAMTGNVDNCPGGECRPCLTYNLEGDIDNARDRGSLNDLNRDLIFGDDYSFVLNLDFPLEVIIETTIGDRFYGRSGNVIVDGVSESISTSPNEFQTVIHNPAISSSYVVNMIGRDISVTSIVIKTANGTTLYGFDFGLPSSPVESGYIQVLETTTSPVYIGTNCLSERTLNDSNLTFSWSGPSNFTSSDASITMVEDGIYTVTVTDDNGCTATDDVTLRHLEVEPGQISEPIIACPSNNPEPIESLEPGSSCNLLDNHEFINDIGSDWFLHTENGGVATTSIDNSGQLSGDNSIFVDVTTTTPAINHIRLQQIITGLLAGETYEISFEARAEIARDIRIRIINLDDFSTLAQQVFTLSTSVNSYSFNFVNSDNVNNVRFHVEFGNSEENFWIDNLVVEPQSCQEAIIDYVWECRESDGAGGWLDWETINGANGETYNPPVQMTDKQYRRLASIEGCDDFESSNIITIELCPCEVLAEADETICIGESVQLSAVGEGTGSFDYTWSPATGLDNPNSATPIATPVETTIYTVTAVDSRGCSVTGEVTVTVRPELELDAGPDEEICVGEDVQLNATSTGGVIYSWGPITGLSNPNIANPVANPTSTTTYMVTVTDVNGCTEIDDVIVNVFDLPDDFVVTSEDAICGEDFGSITVTWTTVVGATDLEFSLDGGATFEPAVPVSNETITFTDITPGTYDLIVRRGDDRCLLDIDDAAIQDIIEPTVDAGLDEEICPSETAAFTPIVTAGTEPFTYNWTGPNGFASNDADINVSEEGEYILHILDANGCEDMDTVQVNVLELDPGEISTPAMVCPENNPETILSVTPAFSCDPADTGCVEPSIVYTWECRESDGAGGFTPWTIIPTANGESYDPPVQLVVKQYRRVASILGCAETYTSNEIEIDVCPCDVVVDDVTICVGEEAALNAIATGFGTITYDWSPAATLSDATVANPIATPDMTTVYTVIATDETGCVSTANATVTVQDSTVIFCERYRVRYDDANWQQWMPFTGECIVYLCEGTGITDLQFDGGPNINTGWVWRDEDGNIDNEEDELVVFNNLGLDDAGIYTGELTNENGCVSRLSFEVVVDQNVIANAGPDMAQCEGGDPVTLTATGGMTYLWDDPAGSTTESITVNPSVTTTYTVTVTDGTCFDTDQVTVTVNPNPVVDAGPDITLCLGESGQLGTQLEAPFNSGNFQVINATHQSELGSIESLFNNVDDTGGRSFHATRINSGQDWGIGYSLGGTFSINDVSIDRRNDCCTTSGNGGVIQILSGGVVVYESNIVTGSGNGELFATPAISAISGDEVRYIFKNGMDTEGGDMLNFSEFNIYLEDPTMTGSLTYEWSPIEGLSNPNIQNPIVSPTMTTTYVVTVTDENGCTGTDDITVIVNDTPAVTNVTSVDATCGVDNGSITIEFDDVAGITNLEFSLDGGMTYEPIVNDSDGTITYDNLPAGVYELVVRDPVTLCGGDLEEVVITDIPVEGEVGPDHTICIGGSATITASGGATYQWDDPTGSTDASVTVTPTTSTTYNVTITDANGCETIDEVIVVVSDPLAVINDPTDQCVNGNDIVISASPVPGTEVGDSGVFTPQTGLADNGDGTASIDVAVAGPGIYTVEYTYTNALGCPAVATTEVEIFDIPTADAGIDVTICEGDSIQLMATGTGTTFEWSPATGLSDPNVADPMAFPTTTTTYTVTVTSAEGCTATDEVTVNVNESLDASAVVVENDYCEDGSGEVTVTVLNGTGPFTIEWQNTEGNEVGNANLLSIGDYTLTGLNGGTTYCIQVTDSNGCTIISP